MAASTAASVAYLAFYNPINLTRTIFKDLRDRVLRRRFKWQLIGGSMILPTILKQLPYAASLAFRDIQRHPTMPPRCLPMVDARTRERVKWAIDADVVREPEVVPLTLPELSPEPAPVETHVA